MEYSEIFLTPGSGKSVFLSHLLGQLVENNILIFVDYDSEKNVYLRADRALENYISTQYRHSFSSKNSIDEWRFRSSRSFGSVKVGALRYRESYLQVKTIESATDLEFAIVCCQTSDCAFRRLKEGSNPEEKDRSNNHGKYDLFDEKNLEENFFQELGIFDLFLGKIVKDVNPFFEKIALILPIQFGRILIYLESLSAECFPTTQRYPRGSIVRNLRDFTEPIELLEEIIIDKFLEEALTTLNFEFIRFLLHYEKYDVPIEEPNNIQVPIEWNQVDGEEIPSIQLTEEDWEDLNAPLEEWDKNDDSELSNEYFPEVSKYVLLQLEDAIRKRDVYMLRMVLKMYGHDIGLSQPEDQYEQKKLWEEYVLRSKKKLSKNMWSDEYISLMKEIFEEDSISDPCLRKPLYE